MHELVKRNKKIFILHSWLFNVVSPIFQLFEMRTSSCMRKTCMCVDVHLRQLLKMLGHRINMQTNILPLPVIIY